MVSFLFVLVEDIKQMNDLKEKQKIHDYEEHFEYLSAILYYLINVKHAIPIDIQSTNLHYFINKYDYFAYNEFCLYHTCNQCNFCQSNIFKQYIFDYISIYLYYLFFCSILSEYPSSCVDICASFSITKYKYFQSIQFLLSSLYTTYNVKNKNLQYRINKKKIEYIKTCRSNKVRQMEITINNSHWEPILLIIFSMILLIQLQMIVLMMNKI